MAAFGYPSGLDRLLNCNCEVIFRVIFRDRLKIIDNWVKLAFVNFHANTADESFGGGGGLPLYDAYGEWDALF
jgi:hypothetical protein